jgi:hypothetical protein
MEVLKASAIRGRLLGILNFSNTLPSIAVPMIGLALLREADGYIWLFIGAATLMGAGTSAFFAIKSVR